MRCDATCQLVSETDLIMANPASDPPVPTQALAKALRLLRTAADREPDELAGAAGLGPQELEDIEAGHIEPAADTVRRLASALGLDVDSVQTLAANLESVAGEAAEEGGTAAVTGGAAQDADAGATAAAGTAEGDTAATVGGGTAESGVTDPAETPSTGADFVPDTRRQAHYRQARANAEITLADPALMGQLLEGIRDHLRDPEIARLGDVLWDLQALIRLLEAHLTGRFRSVSRESLVLVVAALRYVVSPEDVVPDYLEGGYVDDAAVVAFVSEMIASDLDAFLDWEEAGG